MLVSKLLQTFEKSKSFFLNFFKTSLGHFPNCYVSKVTNFFLTSKLILNFFGKFFSWFQNVKFCNPFEYITNIICRNLRNKQKFNKFLKLLYII